MLELIWVFYQSFSTLESWGKIHQSEISTKVIFIFRDWSGSQIKARYLSNWMGLSFLVWFQDVSSIFKINIDPDFFNKIWDPSLARTLRTKPGPVIGL
jgi:hypothetical protein